MRSLRRVIESKIVHDRIIFLLIYVVSSKYFFFLKKCDGYRCILLLHVDELLCVYQIIESYRIE